MNPLMHFCTWAVRRHANPHPSDTFQVTLRGETAPVSGHAEEKPSSEVSQGKKDATFDRLTPFAKHVGRSMLTDEVQSFRKDALEPYP